MSEITPEVRAELFKSIRKGRLAQQLIRMEVWNVITDTLADRQQDIALEALYKGQATVDKTALDSAFASGRSAEIENTVKIVDRIIADGKEAEKKLKELKLI